MYRVGLLSLLWRFIIDNQLLHLTVHASLRRAQRNLSTERIWYVRRYGKRIHRTGCVFYILRGRDIPPEHRHDDAYSKLEGTVVLVGAGDVITVYRNRSAYRSVRKKLKYRLSAAG